MADCRARIELGLEIFEIQSELEDSDVEVGLLRQSAGSAKARRAKGGGAGRPEAAKNVSPRRSFRRMTDVRLTKDGRFFQIIDLICHRVSPVCQRHSGVVLSAKHCRPRGLRSGLK